MSESLRGIIKREVLLNVSSFKVFEQPLELTNGQEVNNGGRGGGQRR